MRDGVNGNRAIGDGAIGIWGNGAIGNGVLGNGELGNGDGVSGKCIPYRDCIGVFVTITGIVWLKFFFYFAVNVVFFYFDHSTFKI